MAEYYPLISRAVAGLRTGTPEARRGIYDRARQALTGQLRSLDPPVPEEAIARETAALDEAIARVESDLAVPAAGPDPIAPEAPAVAKPAAAKPEVRPAPRATSPAATRPAAPIVPPEMAARPVRPPGIRARDAATDRGSAAPAVSVGEPARSAAAPPSAPRVESSSPAVLPTVAALKVEPVDQKTPVTEMPPQESGILPSDADNAERLDAKDGGDRGRDESVRPAAPRPVEAKRPNLRVLIVCVSALAAVIVIAFTAWRLRDRPEDVSRAPIAAQSPTPAGKIGERAGGESAATAASQADAAISSDRATQSSTEQPATPPRDEAAVAPAQQAQPVAAVSAPASAVPAIPIAYKAAILVDAPDLPEKVKTYVGTVVWRIENVAQGQDQPTGTALRADIDVPEAKVQLAVEIRRNTEAQFPASHTIELKFTVAADSPIGSVKQINVPQMRQQDMPTGDPLAGIPVTIADNNFLVGLVRGAPEDRNVELLRSRSWFDIPLLLASGKASKITFEKGTSGERIFNDILDSWKNAQN